MIRKNLFPRFLFLLFAFQLLTPSLFCARVLAQSDESAKETLSVQRKEELTKAIIAEKKDAIEQTEKVLDEAEEIKEQAEITERKAELVRVEAELLKAEAKQTADASIKKKAEAAAREAGKLEAEAVEAREKLRLAESRALLAQEKIASDQKEIEVLRRQLQDARLESTGLGDVARWINKPLFRIGDSPVTIAGIGSAGFIFFIAFFLSMIVQRIIVAKLSRASRLKSGAIYAIGRVVHYLIIVFAAILAAQCVGLNLGSLAVVFGFLSVGIGFGLQNITSNFISGLILLFERPIAVGDFVTVDDQRGTVRQINMRSSLIETLDNVRIIVPNSKFIEGNVTNWSHGSTNVRIHCKVGVAYGSDTSKVKETLLEVAAGNKDVLERPAPAVRFVGFGDSALDFELLVWIVEPEMQYVIHSDINFAIDAAFREAGIQIPFPQRDLHIKSSEVSF